jgi:hypothetical protein
VDQIDTLIDGMSSCPIPVGLKLMEQYKLVRRSYGYVLHCRPTGFGRCDHHQGAGYCFGNCGAGVVVLPLLGSRWLQSRTLIIV